MNAVRTTIRADIRRRTLQSLVIAVVILLSSGAATLALSLLVASDAPYDHAFAQARGAHLTLAVDAYRATVAQLRATESAPRVTAAAGPWPQAMVALSIVSAAQAPAGKVAGTSGPLGIFTVVGRDDPAGAVDRLTIESGRWVRAPGEIVLSQRIADWSHLGIGDQLRASGAHAQPTLRVVGIAASIGPDTDAWVVARQAPALAMRDSPLLYQVAYRVNPAATSADLRAAEQSITAHLPLGAVATSSTYLAVKLNADRLTAVMIPFLLAFSAFALLAAALIIANVVTGVVIAGYRDIGIMKSVGFTPAQVMLVLLGQILAPAIVGCGIGMALGTIGSQPFLRDTAHALGLPSPFTAVIPTDLLVLAIVLAIAILAALAPAWRAGRLSAVMAIARGSAPAARDGAGGERWLSQLPLPRPLTLGLGDALVRPLRSTTTTGAILIGVATVVFALSLHLSLGQVAGHLIRDRYVQVDVYRQVKGMPGPGPAPATDAQAAALLRAQAGTARFVAEAQVQAVVPGIAEPIPYDAYRGDASWIGYALIAGRWFAGPHEVVAPTKLLAETHLRVGDSFTAHIQGRPVRLHLVGEIFDQQDDDLLLRGGWSTVAAAAPALQPDQYEVQLKAATNPDAYVRAIRNNAAMGLDAQAVENSATDTSFILLNGVIGGLALILTAIAVAGVFNTVLLTTREKVRDVAILKAIGMAPRQVVAMVVASVAVLGLVAGAFGIPAGLLLHRAILQTMGQVATGTNIPAGFFDLIGHAVLPLLALTGVAVAALGAWIPAQWAAAGRVAAVLQAE